MRAHLTDIAVRALKPAQKQFRVWDTTTPGFGVLINSRSKSWIVMFGKTRTLKTIGRYPDMPLADARKQAKRFLLEPSQPSSITFEDALDLYLETQQWRPRTKQENERLLRRHFLPTLGHKSLEQITTHDIHRIFDDIPTPPLRAHVFAAARTFFRWAHGRRFVAHSPLEGLKLACCRFSGQHPKLTTPVFRTPLD